MSVNKTPSSNPSGSKHGPNDTAEVRKTSPVEIAATSSNPDRPPLTTAISQATSPKEKHLTEDQIREAAEEFYKIHGRFPNVNDTDKAVPGMSDETWSGINAAGYNGHRGLEYRRTLFQILEPLRNELNIVPAKD